MPSKDSIFRKHPDTYRWQTHQPLNCLVLVVPLLIFFHIGSAFSKTTLFASRDLEQILGVFGAAACYLPPLLIVAVLLLIHLVGRYPWRVQPVVLVGMVIESLLWALPICAVNYILDYCGMLAAGVTLDQTLLAVGAGVYEELIFRLLLIGAVMWIFVGVFELKRDFVILAALVVSALAFSLYHFSWSQADVVVPFNWGLFVFRSLAGLCLGVAYIYRGFGIAVGAHTLWNLYFIATHINAE